MRPTSETNFRSPKLRSEFKMRWRSLVNRWPVFVWIGIAILAAFFYVKSTQFGTLPGSAQTIEHDLSPLQTARVKEICVKIGDSVTNGQMVAKMDTTIIDAQVAEAAASLAAAESSWAAYEDQMLSLARTADNDISSAQVLIAQQKDQQETEAAKLAELKQMQAKRDELFKNKLITEVEDDALRPEIAGLERAVASHGPLIGMYTNSLERAKKNREDIQQSLHVGADGDLRKAIALKTSSQTEILKSAVEMKKLERETYFMRSQGDGVVSAINVLPGATAKPGDIVVSVVSPSHLIVGYLPEARRGYLKLNDEGYAFRLTSPPVKVRVAAVAPGIDPIPASARPATAAQQSGITFRAQRIIFETDSSDLAPGESVQIRLTSSFWAKVRYRIGLQW